MPGYNPIVGVMTMTDLLAKELRAILDNFFSNATDQEFWSAIEDADAGIYSSINDPVFSWHRLFELTQRFNVDLEDVTFYSMPVETSVEPHGNRMDLSYSEEPFTEPVLPLCELPTAA
jgi:hypothetical protein